MSSRRIPLYVHIAYLFLGLLLTFAAVNLIHQFWQSKQLITKDAEARFTAIGQLTIKELESLFRPAALSTSLLAQQRLMHAHTLEERLLSLPYLATLLSAQPATNSAYAGYENGEFFLLRPWQDGSALTPIFNPPANTHWIVENIQIRDGQASTEHLFLSQDLNLIERRARPDIHYDPRTRPWYQQAKNRGHLVQTEPYLSLSTQEVDISFAEPMANAAGMVGVDISLRSVEQTLLAAMLTPNMRLALLNSNDEILITHKGTPLLPSADGSRRLAKIDEVPLLQGMALPMLQRLVTEAESKQSDYLRFAAADDNWQGMRMDLPVPNGPALSLWIAAPEAELLADAISMRNQGLVISLGFLVLGIIATLLLARTASRPLDALTVEAEQIEQFDFSSPVDVPTKISEIADLAHAMGHMKATIQRFLELSTALSSETNFQQLLARLLNEMQQITGATGSMIYVTDADASHLQLARACWGERLLETPEQAAIALATQPGHPLIRALNSAAGKPERLSAATLHEHFQHLPEISQPLSLWAIALNNRDGRLLGVLALMVDENQHPLTTALMAFVQALSSTAAVALNTQRLLDEQKILLESFIQLIAGAIDAKSPYTGGHCQRVPELTKMLARAACEAQDGPFCDFALTDEQWEELHIAAWLHDCGKVTTPEYVVDKATKLETLYDRIHEIRMRFEVLKRDAELDHWKAIAAGGDARALQEQLSAQLQQLDDDFAFVAQCNEGGEFMAPERIARIQALAQRTWRRTLSDHIGISQDESTRKQRIAEAVLPTEEPLLADRPDHILPRSAHDSLAPDNPWGFKVEVPEHLYNRGELYNLCIGRGTLAAEERYKINEHMIQTIIMLEKLPFPQRLKNVPEIAGGHHEKMDGTGYPKRLKREEMSVPARMMAIADIFEALTAGDRPYKKAKKLSEAIKIMGFMQKDQHIDAELFALFLRSGVYRQYAERYMAEELRDEVDITPYLG